MKHNYTKVLLISTALMVISEQSACSQQRKRIDSLSRRLRQLSSDTNYVLTQNAYAWQLLQRSDFGQADSLLGQAERMAVRLNYDYGLEQTYYNRALSYYYQDKSALSLPYVRKAQQLIAVRHFPPKDEQMVLALLGVIYFTRHDYDQSLRLYLTAIHLTETNHLTYRVTPAYLGVGNVLRVLGKKEAALVYYRKALTAAGQEPEKRMLVLAKSHMGDALSSLDKPRYSEALRYYEQALPVAEQCGAHGPLSDVLTSIGQMHLEMKHYSKAVAYLRRSERVCADDHLTDQLGAVCRIMGRTYQVTKQYPVAKHYFLKALQLAQQIGDADEIRTRTKSLARFYAQTDQYKRAYNYQQQTTDLNDSLFTVQSARHAQELTMQYETEKKEQQLRLLNEKNQSARIERNALLAGGVLILLLGAAVSAWLLNRARLRRLEEAQTLRKQIAHDLHDEVGSTLSSISLLSGMVNGLIAQNRPESVTRAVEKINTDARQIIEAVDEIIWTINPGNDSLHRIALRLKEYAQPLMESKNIQFALVADPVLDALPIAMEMRRNLYLIGKEAINNLVKYSEATQATLRFDYQNDQLKVVIEDNGRGFDLNQPSSRTGQSSMQQRAEATGGSLEIQSVQKEGTRLVLTISLVYTMVLSVGLLLFSSPSKAQTATIDSLQRVVSIQKQDTNRANTLLALSKAFQAINNRDKALQYANNALSLAQKLNADKFITEAHMRIGFAIYYTGLGYETNLKAQQNLLLALKAKQKTGSNESLAMLYHFIGTIYLDQGNFSVGLDYVYKGLKLFQKTGNKRYEAQALQVIASIFIDQGDDTEALKYLSESIKIRRAIQDKWGIVQSLNTIAFIYQNQGNYTQALHNSMAALKLANEPGLNRPTWIQPFTYSTLGEIYDSKADHANGAGDRQKAIANYQLALTSFSTSLEFWKKAKSPGAIVETTLMIGNITRKLNQPATAEQLLNRALRGALALKDTSLLMRGYRFLSQLDSAKGNYGQAYGHYKTHILYQNSIFNQQKNQKLTEVKMQYAFDKKEALAKAEQEKKETRIKMLQQEAKLNQQQTERAHFRTNALLTVGVLLLLLSVTLSAWLLNRSRLRRLQEAHALRTQIAHDLHDEVGSTLSSISMLSGHTDTLLNQNRPESAQKMVQKIYTDARQILESIDEIIWTINPGNDSVHRIALRLKEYAQPLMESQNITFHFSVDASLDQFPVSMEIRRNLYLIGKEAINNLVKYSQATNAALRFTQLHEQLSVLIEDNGQGFDATQPGERTGQASMQQRAETIGGKLAVRSEPGQGTRLELIVNS